ALEALFRRQAREPLLGSQLLEMVPEVVAAELLHRHGHGDTLLAITRQQLVQATREGRVALADDDQVEQLLLPRQVYFGLDGKGRIGQEIGADEGEQLMPQD